MQATDLKEKINQCKKACLVNIEEADIQLSLIKLHDFARKISFTFPKNATTVEKLYIIYHACVDNWKYNHESAMLHNEALENGTVFEYSLHNNMVKLANQNIGVCQQFSYGYLVLCSMLIPREEKVQLMFCSGMVGEHSSGHAFNIIGLMGNDGKYSYHLVDITHGIKAKTDKEDIDEAFLQSLVGMNDIYKRCHPETRMQMPYMIRQIHAKTFTDDSLEDFSDIALADLTTPIKRGDYGFRVYAIDYFVDMNSLFIEGTNVDKKGIIKLSRYDLSKIRETIKR